MTSVRKLGVLLVALLIGSLVFTGGALAQDDDVQDIDQTNVQVAGQDASIDQDQSSTTFNAALVNGDDQTAITNQEQDASIDQDIEQDQDADLRAMLSF